MNAENADAEVKHAITIGTLDGRQFVLHMPCFVPIDQFIGHARAAGGAGNAGCWIAFSAIAWAVGHSWQEGQPGPEVQGMTKQ